MQIVVKSLCNMKNKGDIHGKGHVYFLNSKPIKYKTYINILHYVNKKSWKKHVKIFCYKNMEGEKFLQHEFTFSNNNLRKINLP